MPKMESPLRYPGGKAKLYSYVSDLIENEYNDILPVYAEAYAGGFGLGIKLLLNNKVSSVLINDLDPAIYAFWKCVTSGHIHDKFVQMIIETPVDIDHWKEQRDIYLSGLKTSYLRYGFATFYLNRCNRSGIIEANPIGGINQNGNYLIDCRFNKDHLIHLINRIYAVRDKITVTNEDAIDFAKRVDSGNDTVFFNFDPPYVEAGPSLYQNSYTEHDHKELSNCINKLKNKWILTYDDSPLIRNLYTEVLQYNIRYSLADKKLAHELIIFDKRINNQRIPNIV